MSHIIAIDQGTSSTRAIIFDGQGHPLAMASEMFDMTFPEDGWVEQDPEVLWQSTLRTVHGALQRARLTAAQITAIGITNQRETTLVWDRSTGECIHPAIVWQDRRTADRCDELRAQGRQPEVNATTGLLLDPYFSATKIAWLLDQVPGARARAERGELCFGTVDSFLIWRLTGGRRHVTDATNASRTLLFDLDGQCWSEAMMTLFDVPAAMLPEVLDSAAEFGVTDAFGPPIPILGVAGDQQAALVGQGCFTAGSGKCTYGTGCFAMTNTGERRVQSTQQLLTTVAYRVAGQPTFALEGSVFAAGVAVKWLRDAMGLITDPAQTEAIAARVGYDTGGVYVVPAFTGLGAPYWDAQARGSVTGLTLDSGSDQVVTATLQAVVYQTVDLLSAMIGDGAMLEHLRVDGGMVVNDWLCQCIADFAAVPVERPVVNETTALGAAVLAALTAGELSGFDAAAERWRCERLFQPAIESRQRESLYAGWRDAVAQVRRKT